MMVGKLGARLGRELVAFDIEREIKIESRIK